MRLPERMVRVVVRCLTPTEDVYVPLYLVRRWAPEPARALQEALERFTAEGDA